MDQPLPSDISRDIARKLGFDGLTQVEQEALLDKIGAVLFERILFRTVALMSANDAREFAVLLDSDPTEEAMLLFLRNRVPEFDDIATEEVESFQIESLNAMGEQV
jgi:hypothetical protein